MAIKRKQPVSITLTDKDRRKADQLAAEQGLNRSELMRKLIRSRRLKKGQVRKTLLGQAL